jgi:tetratricopeptide (TPR) repeat protein
MGRQTASIVGRFRIEIIIAVVLAAAVLGVFARCCNNGFVNFDDETYVARDPFVLGGFNIRNATWALTAWRAANWHPLTWWSLQLDAQLFREVPESLSDSDPALAVAPEFIGPGNLTFGFHLTNILLHTANTLLLYGLLLAMTGRQGPSLLVAALFGLHPLHVESVAWVAERKDVLSTLFWLLTMWAYWHYVQRPGLARYLGVVLCLGLGLLAKPMLVTLPVILFLLDFWPVGRMSLQHSAVLSGMSRRDSQIHPASIERLLLEKAPLLIMSIASSAVTIWVQDKGQALRGLDRFPADIRIGNALTAYGKYIFKLFWPSGLAVYYPHPEKALSLPIALVAGACLLLATALAWQWRARLPYAVVGWLWYLITLMPVIGLVQVGLQAMADRYTYIPYVGLFVMFIWGACDLADRASIPRQVLGISSGAVVVACVFLSWRQIAYWQDSVTLWRHALAVEPNNDLGHYNLGQALAVAGERQYRDMNQLGRPREAVAARLAGWAEAAHEFQETRKIKNDHKEATYNLGVILEKTGDHQGAIKMFREVLHHHPDSDEAHFSLALEMARMGFVDEAVYHYREAVRIRPDNMMARNNLAAALIQQGKLDDAAKEYAAILEQYPANQVVEHNLGSLLMQQGKYEQAVQHFQRALQLRGDNAQAFASLGLAFSLLGRKTDALACFQRAAAIDRRAPQYHAELAHAYSELGQQDQARRCYQIALALGPSWPEATCRQAWHQATASESRKRWGVMSLHLATLLCEAQPSKPEFSDVLAAAYAEVGRFADAAATERRAMDGISPLSAEYQAMASRLRLYDSRKPYREAGPERGP